MLKRFREMLVFVSLFILPISTALAWDDDITHRDLSEVAAERSVLGKGYLQDDLKVKDGLDTDLLWDGGESKEEKTILEWIREGGEFEDASGRFFNHFHNPLHSHPWNGAGMDDAVLGFSFTGGSALLWAQNAGIFKDPDKTDRDAFLAQTFRGLGHQVHLIQDMSQPSHVRNAPPDK